MTQRYQTDALAAAGGREREHMLWSVMPEVVQSVASARAPTTDIDALLRIKWPVASMSVGDAQRAEPMQVFSVWGQALGSAEVHSVREDDCNSSACDHDQRTRQQQEPNPWIRRTAIPKQPGCPGEGWYMEWS